MQKSVQQCVDSAWLLVEIDVESPSETFKQFDFMENIFLDNPWLESVPEYHLKLLHEWTNKSHAKQFMKSLNIYRVQYTSR